MISESNRTSSPWKNMLINKNEAGKKSLHNNQIAKRTYLSFHHLN